MLYDKHHCIRFLCCVHRKYMKLVMLTSTASHSKDPAEVFMLDYVILKSSSNVCLSCHFYCSLSKMNLKIA